MKTVFAGDIQAFNKMYKLPIPTVPTLLAVGDPFQRLVDFKKILDEELEEVETILVRLANETKTPESELNILTEIADLFGDIQVYCASEMAKFGLPNDEVLSIIMESNFSKLGADGQPIYDERGKVQKGPNYWKPEPRISEFLLSLMVPPPVSEVQKDFTDTAFGAFQKTFSNFKKTDAAHIWVDAISDPTTPKYCFEDETSNFNGMYLTIEEAKAQLAFYLKHYIQ